jgi:hypothetical protein
MKHFPLKLSSGASWHVQHGFKGVWTDSGLSVIANKIKKLLEAKHGQNRSPVGTETLENEHK